MELIRVCKKESFGITSPLITLASGSKMGKTERGAIWLNKDLLSPYDYWQFWRNTDDRDVKKFFFFLKFFTEIETDKIDNLFNRENNINNLKIILANEATKILHGDKASKEAEQTAKETFTGSGLGSSLPEIKVNLIDAKKGINFLDFLSKNKIVSSKSEGRRAIMNHGF